MSQAVLPGLTSLLALGFSVALFDQWRERRGGFQLIWGVGMLFYGIAAGAEALAAAGGWTEMLYRTWYLTGAVWTAGWLGLGTAFLLARTRFGYAFALCLFLAGLFTFLVRNRPEYAGAGVVPLLYFIGAGVLALAVAVETYFQNERWPALAAGAVVGATILSVGLMATTQLAAPGYALDPATGAPVAILVNLVASLPGAARDLVRGRLHSRVPATILIAIGAFIPSITDSLNRFGSTDLFQLGKFLGVVFLFGGFLVSVEVFREIRIPFTSIRLATGRRERAPSGAAATGSTATATGPTTADPTA
jgi:hypothetical protein